MPGTSRLKTIPALGEVLIGPEGQGIRTRGCFSKSKPMRLNFANLPSLEKMTALTFSVPGRSKNPDGI
jgi:hypothetical protein